MPPPIRGAGPATCEIAGSAFSHLKSPFVYVELPQCRNRGLNEFSSGCGPSFSRSEGCLGPLSYCCSPFI